MTRPSPGRGRLHACVKPERRGVRAAPRPAAVGGGPRSRGAAGPRWGASPGPARRRAAPPTAEGPPSRGCAELPGVRGCRGCPVPVPPPSHYGMMLEEHFLLITAKSGTGHLAKVLSPFARAPTAAAPHLEAPGRGRQDAGNRTREPRARPDPAGSSTGLTASASRDNTNQPAFLVQDPCV